MKERKMEVRKTNNSEKLIIVIACLAVFAGVFTSIADYAGQINVAGLPSWLQSIVVAFLRFLQGSPGIVILAFFRNITGYLYNWVANHKTETVTYEFDRTAKTISMYFAFIAPFLAVIPAPLNIYAYPVGFIVDLVTSELGKLRATPTTTPPATTPALPEGQIGTYLGWTVSILNSRLTLNPPASLQANFGTNISFGSIAGYPEGTDFMVMAKKQIDAMVAAMQSPNYHAGSPGTPPPG